MAGMVRRGVNYWLVDIPIGRGVTLTFFPLTQIPKNLIGILLYWSIYLMPIMLELSKKSASPLPQLILISEPLPLLAFSLLKQPTKSFPILDLLLLLLFSNQPFRNLCGN
jgi:hypothetical protein